MKHIKTGATRTFFKVLAGTRSAQAAMMVLQPGQDTGEPASEHPRSEQWLFSTVHVTSAVSGQLVAMGQVTYRLLEPWPEG